MMSNVQHFRPRRHNQPADVTPRPTDPAGSIEDFADTGNPPAHAKPDDAEILKAIGELHKKLNTLAKNQKVLSNQLRNLRGLIYNTSDNVILTANYLEQVMYNIG